MFACDSDTWNISTGSAANAQMQEDQVYIYFF